MLLKFFCFYLERIVQDLGLILNWKFVNYSLDFREGFFVWKKYFRFYCQTIFRGYKMNFCCLLVCSSKNTRIHKERLKSWIWFFSQEIRNDSIKYLILFSKHHFSFYDFLPQKLVKCTHIFDLFQEQKSTLNEKQNNLFRQKRRKKFPSIKLQSQYFPRCIKATKK